MKLDFPYDPADEAGRILAEHRYATIRRVIPERLCLGAGMVRDAVDLTNAYGLGAAFDPASAQYEALAQQLVAAAGRIRIAADYLDVPAEWRR